MRAVAIPSLCEQVCEKLFAKSTAIVYAAKIETNDRTIVREDFVSNLFVQFKVCVFSQAFVGSVDAHLIHLVSPCFVCVSLSRVPLYKLQKEKR